MRVSVTVRAKSKAELKKVFGDLARRWPKVKSRIEEEMCKLIAREVRNGIRTQRLNLTPNAPSTVRRKGTSIPLIETQRYVAGIRASKSPRGWGVKANMTLANWHENGVPGMGIPPRPHWGPTLMSMSKGPLRKKVARVVANELFGNRPGAV